MNIIARATWNARKPKTAPTRVSASRREYFVVHHSGAPSTQSVRAIQDWCMDGRGFADVDYNFLVRAGTGDIYEGRGWDAVGSHTVNYNTNGIGVCVIGNNELGPAAAKAVRWLYEQANKRCGKTLKVRGHRDLATTGTTCPGDVIYRWLRDGMPTTASALDEVEDDMAISDADLAKIRAMIVELIDKRMPRAVAGFDPGRDPKTGSTWPGVSDETFAQTPTSNGTVAIGTAIGTLLARQAAQTQVLAALASKDMVDEQAIAQALAPLVAASLPAGQQITVDVVAAAVRQVFSSVGR